MIHVLVQIDQGLVSSAYPNKTGFWMLDMRKGMIFDLCASPLLGLSNAALCGKFGAQRRICPAAAPC